MENNDEIKVIDDTDNNTDNKIIIKKFKLNWYNVCNGIKYQLYKGLYSVLLTLINKEINKNNIIDQYDLSAKTIEYVLNILNKKRNLSKSQII